MNTEVFQVNTEVFQVNTEVLSEYRSIPSEYRSIPSEYSRIPTEVWAPTYTCIKRNTEVITSLCFESKYPIVLAKMIQEIDMSMDLQALLVDEEN